MEKEKTNAMEMATQASYKRKAKKKTKESKK